MLSHALPCSPHANTTDDERRKALRQREGSSTRSAPVQPARSVQCEWRCIGTWELPAPLARKRLPFSIQAPNLPKDVSNYPKTHRDGDAAWTSCTRHHAHRLSGSRAWRSCSLACSTPWAMAPIAEIRKGPVRPGEHLPRARPAAARRTESRSRCTRGCTQCDCRQLRMCAWRHRWQATFDPKEVVAPARWSHTSAAAASTSHTARLPHTTTPLTAARTAAPTTSSWLATPLAAPRSPPLSRTRASAPAAAW